MREAHLVGVGGAVALNIGWVIVSWKEAGLLVAGSVHATKAAVRPVANAGTAGVAAPVLSTIEDAFSLVLSLAAVLVPVLALVLLAVFLLNSPSSQVP